MQFGYVPAILIIVVIFSTIYFMYIFGSNIIFIFIIVVGVILLPVFTFLRTEVNQKEILISLGFLFFTKKLELSEILNYRRSPEQLYTAWGMRKTKNGWDFSVQGHEAVEIVMRNGEIYRLGTTEPEKLLKALDYFKHKQTVDERLPEKEK